MVIDHLGAYFFPDIATFRIIGRLSAPIWLFLIGFAKSREISIEMIIGAFILAGTHTLAEGSPLPLCILVTIMLVRATLDGLMRFMNGSSQNLYIAVILLTVIGMFTVALFEYGTAAYLAAVIGYFCRRRKLLPRSRLIAIMLSCAAGYIFVQIFTFSFKSLTDGLIAGAGILAVFWLLLDFKPQIFPAIQGIGAEILMFCGRQTLLIYVAHLAAFQLIAEYVIPRL